MRIDNVIGRSAMTYLPFGRVGFLPAASSWVSELFGGMPAGTMRERYP